MQIDSSRAFVLDLAKKKSRATVIKELETISKDRTDIHYVKCLLSQRVADEFHTTPYEHAFLRDRELHWFSLVYALTAKGIGDVCIAVNEIERFGGFGAFKGTVCILNSEGNIHAYSIENGVATSADITADIGRPIGVSRKGLILDMVTNTELDDLERKFRSDETNKPARELAAPSISIKERKTAMQAHPETKDGTRSLKELSKDSPPHIELEDILKKPWDKSELYVAPQETIGYAPGDVAMISEIMSEEYVGMGVDPFATHHILETVPEEYDWNKIVRLFDFGTHPETDNLILVSRSRQDESPYYIKCGVAYEK